MNKKQELKDDMRDEVEETIAILKKLDKPKPPSLRGMLVLYMYMLELYSCVCLSVCLSFCLSVCLSISVCLYISIISKIALVIIENGARWLVENFVLSRYNHR